MPDFRTDERGMRNSKLETRNSECGPQKNAEGAKTLLRSTSTGLSIFNHRFSTSWQPRINTDGHELARIKMKTTEDTEHTETDLSSPGFQCGRCVPWFPIRVHPCPSVVKILLRKTTLDCSTDSAADEQEATERAENQGVRAGKPRLEKATRISRIDTNQYSQ